MIDEARRILQKNEVTNVRLYAFIQDIYTVDDYICETNDAVLYLVSNLNINRQFLCAIEKEPKAFALTSARTDWQTAGTEKRGVVDAAYLDDGTGFMVYELCKGKVELAKNKSFRSIDSAVELIQGDTQDTLFVVPIFFVGVLVLIALIQSIQQPVIPPDEYSAMVQLTTNVPGCELHIFKLDEFNEPLFESGTMGVSPLTIRLGFGDYLVSAISPNGDWNEVYRRVPFAGQLPQPYSTVKFEQRSDGVFVLPTIPIVDFNNQKMVRRDGYWQDCLARHSTDGSYDRAMSILEKEGKRIPRVSEKASNHQHFEWTSTSNGQFVNYSQIGQSIDLIMDDGKDSFNANRLTINPKHSFRGVRSFEPLKVVQQLAL